MSLPYATWCLQWLTNHVPHECLVFAIFLMCILIAILIIFVVVILFLMLTWIYVYVFAYLANVIPRVFKHIHCYFMVIPLYRALTSLLHFKNRIAPSDNTASATTVRPVHLPSSSNVADSNTSPNITFIPHYLPRALTQSISCTSRQGSPLDPNRPFIRCRDHLYARVQLPVNIGASDLLPNITIEPTVATSPSTSVPPIPLPSSPAVSSPSVSAPSTAR